MKSKTVPYNQYVLFEEDYKKEGWQVRGYEEYIGQGRWAKPKFVVLEKKEEPHEMGTDLVSV